jgi:hypothetical protein
MVVDQRFDSVGVHCHALSVAYIIMSTHFSDQPEWQAFSQAMATNRNKIKLLQRKQRGCLHKISSLESGSDLVMKHQWTLEAVPKTVTKTLEQYTANCDECWFSEWGNCYDAMIDAQVSLAIQVSTLNLELTALRTENDELDIAQDEWRDEYLREQRRKEKEVSKK